MKVGKLFIKIPAIVGLLLLIVVSGLAQKVRYNYISGTNFSVYKTYRWVQLTEQSYPNQILDTQIKQAIDRQFALKGLKRIDEGTPDLYITYQVAIDRETEWYGYSDMPGYGWGGWYWGFGAWGTTWIQSRTIYIGTLVLDIYDVGARKQVWTGSAVKEINPSKDPAKNQRNLEKAMAKLLKNYPPPPR